MRIRKYFYNSYIITQTDTNIFIVSDDNSKHTTLQKAKNWIDYLTK